eukprot:3843826-Prymnesium_polylepis.1
MFLPNGRLRRKHGSTRRWCEILHSYGCVATDVLFETLAAPRDEGDACADPSDVCCPVFRPDCRGVDGVQCAG